MRENTITLIGTTVAIWLAAIACSTSGNAAPGVPALLSYQGRLANASDQAITTPTNVRFTLLWGGTASENPSTGKPVYQEDATVTPDGKGVFQHLIGAGTATSGCDENRDGTPNEPCTLTPPDFPDAATVVYLEVRVDPAGTNNVLLPRQRIASVGYAMNADAVDGQEATQLGSSGPNSLTFDSGAISVPQLSTNLLGPYDLDGTGIVSALLWVEAGPGLVSCTWGWRNSIDTPFSLGSNTYDYSGGTTGVDRYTNLYTVIPTTLLHQHNVAGRFLQFSCTTTNVVGTYTYRVVINAR